MTDPQILTQRHELLKVRKALQRKRACGVVRSRRWQMKQKAKGECILCREPRITKNHCDRHRIRENERRYVSLRAARAKLKLRPIRCGVCKQIVRHNSRTCPEREDNTP